MRLFFLSCAMSAKSEYSPGSPFLPRAWRNRRNPPWAVSALKPTRVVEYPRTAGPQGRLAPSRAPLENLPVPIKYAELRALPKTTSDAVREAGNGPPDSDGTRTASAFVSLLLRVERGGRILRIGGTHSLPGI